MSLGMGVNINGDLKGTAMIGETIMNKSCDFTNDSDYFISENTHDSTLALSKVLKMELNFYALKASGGFDMLNEMSFNKNNIIASFYHAGKGSKSELLYNEKI